MESLIKMVLTTALLSQCKVQSAPRIPRHTIAENPPIINFYRDIDGSPGSYYYNYDFTDYATGNTQYRTENRYTNGTVTGTYGYVDAFNTLQRFRYVADQAGYRVYRDNTFKPFYGHGTTTLKPIDKIAIEPTEPSITWTRPKRPNKNRNKIYSPVNKVGFSKYNQRYNLIGPPSLYVPYD